MSAKIKRRSISQRSEMIYDLQEYGINPDTREIFLHSHIDSAEDDEIGVDFRMATTFTKNLRLLTTLNKKPIVVHMHTFGGVWEDGMAIYDAIKSCKDTQITILAYAHARSMSSIILQAADIRVFMPNSVYMMHWGEAEFAGQGKSVAADAKEYMKDHERMIDLYAEVSADGPKWEGITDHVRRMTIDKMIDDKVECYMSPREAIDYGFGDAVLGDEGFETIDSLFRYRKEYFDYDYPEEGGE